MPRHHKIDILYSQLEPTNRQRIVEIFDQLRKNDVQFRLISSYNSPPRDTLDDVLRLIRNLFVKLRYSYEYGMRASYGISVCYRAVLETIFENKPELRHVALTMNPKRVNVANPELAKMVSEHWDVRQMARELIGLSEKDAKSRGFAKQIS